MANKPKFNQTQKVHYLQRGLAILYERLLADLDEVRETLKTFGYDLPSDDEIRRNRR